MPSTLDEVSGQKTPQAADLTLFQQTILVVLAEEQQHGLGIKDELESYYSEDINHGRLYPNLDQLVEMGYINKGQYDKRTNSYTLTDDGSDVIAEQLAWELKRIGSTETDRDTIRSMLPDQ